MALKMEEMLLPNVAADDMVAFGARTLRSFLSVKELIVAHDPLVTRIPTWWLDVPASEEQFTADAIDEWGEDALAAVLDARTRYGGLQAVTYEFGTGMDAILKNFKAGADMNATAKATKDEALTHPFGALARAAAAARLAGMAAPGRHRLSSDPAKTTRELFEKLIVDVGENGGEKELHALALTFLSKSGAKSPRLTGQAGGKALTTLAKVIFARCYYNVITNGYLFAFARHPADADATKDKELRDYVRERRVQAIWWRAKLEIPLYVMRIIARLLLTADVAKHLKEAGLGDTLAAVLEGIDRPMSPIMGALSSWLTQERGPTPTANRGLRLITDRAILAAVTKTQTDLGQPTIIELAKRFVANAYQWVVDLRSVDAVALIDLPSAETAMGFTRGGPDIGRLSIPYGPTSSYVFTSGDGLSVSKLSWGLLASSRFLPVLITTGEGAMDDLAVGNGYRNAQHGFPLPNKLFTAHDSIAHTYVYVEAAEPVQLDAQHVAALELSSFRPQTEYIGSMDATRAVFGASAATTMAELRRLIGPLSDEEITSLFDSMPDKDVTIFTKEDRLLKAAHSRAYYDQYTRRGWMKKVELANVPTVWDDPVGDAKAHYLGATRGEAGSASMGMMVRFNGTRMIDDGRNGAGKSGRYASAYSLTHEAPVAKFDGISGTSDLARQLSELLLPVKT